MKHLTPKALALVLTLAITACEKEQPVAERPLPPALATTSIQRVPVEEALTFDGVLEAVNRATVSAQTAGRITQLPFDVGDLVAKGALVVEITSVEQQAAVASASAQRQEATTHQADAERAFARAQTVFNKKLISKADFDKAQTALAAANARLEAANAALESAKQNLSYTQITAPYAGVVLERHVQVGETVAPGTPLLTGLSLQQLRVAVNLPSSVAAKVRHNPSALVTLADGTELASQKLRFPPSADVASQSFRILVDLPKGQTGKDLNAATPGTLVKVRFPLGSSEQLVVPTRALVKRGEITGVYVLSDASLNFRVLRLGPAMSSNAQIQPVLSGLSLGEQVVTEPAKAVRWIGGLNRE